MLEKLGVLKICILGYVISLFLLNNKNVGQFIIIACVRLGKAINILLTGR